MTGLAAPLLLMAALLSVLAWYRDRGWQAYTVTANAAAACAFLLEGTWQAAVLPAAIVAWVTGRDWWNRRGKRAARALGAKARAVRDGMLEKLREAGSPGPQGVRA